MVKVTQEKDIKKKGMYKWEAKNQVHVVQVPVKVPWGRENKLKAPSYRYTNA